jgi:hypothetical protein
LASFAFSGGASGTATIQDTMIVGPPTPGFSPDASNENWTAPFGYTMDGKGAVEITVTNASGTVLAGTRAGQTFTIDGYTLTATLDSSGKFAAVATTAPVVETITYSNGDAFPRVCHRSALLVSSSG